MIWRPGVEEQLGYYVYLLSDPRSNVVFYVGKGLGGRCFDHLDEARSTKRDSAGDYGKLVTIRDIEASGDEVTIEILRHGLTEEEAFLTESVSIDLLGFSDLANRVVGQGTNWRGRMSVGDVNAQYGAQPVVFDTKHKIILIRVPNRFSKGMSDADLYEATRKWWRMGPRREQAQYALAVHGGVVRAGYVIRGWVTPSEDDIVEDERRRGRVAFVGSRDPEVEARYLYADVSGSFSQGNRNPFKYVGF